MINKPRYPVYIPSKGRANFCFTAKFFIEDGVDFRIVVEPQEYEQYAERFGEERLLKLPFSNLGLGSMPARNFIWQHAKENGHNRHWCFDDNIKWIYRRYKATRLRCNARIALCICEDFTDRYTNIGLSGLNYEMFVPDTSTMNPYHLNCHVYSALLIDNRLPFKWRMRYNEDTDLCLQILDSGLCTVAFNAFLVKKLGTMALKGGNTDELYKGDGRLKMARSLQAMWPKYVKVVWKFGRPQHSVAWTKFFKQQLIRRPDIDWSKIEKVNEYNMQLVAVDKIKSADLQKFYDENTGNKKNKIKTT